ncbi:hypothetical protein GGR91_001477 [Sphingorhabdus rigui]|uniref:Crossover junction endonuclease MUS81-like HHH domain-containing protein n=1 Tax=Sphingorhabdus rigui TaxID=1282858 RepID=A0A840B4Y6_9SPHN|nr:helix-hairpin-helix domain-containing protein [Sphingorhabdus rigui]MBB3943255.1 hypothetical protein [Sphingorhabdus rigui]
MSSARTVRNHTNGFETNATIASHLREAAALLKAQQASPYRSLAYLKAASTIEKLGEDISVVAKRGMSALDALPNVGLGIGAAILEMLSTGQWSQLDRMRGTLKPEAAFQIVPGIGPVLAHEIHEYLHVDTLEALEAAAHDGRLAQVPGIGPKRLSIIRIALNEILSQRGTRRTVHRPHTLPPIALLLSVDLEYRTKARDGQLRLIAPKRLNPEGRAWLPILHTEIEPWHFTALYSNTALAHQLGKTNDWVIIFYGTGNQPEGQCTVVTETSGALKGQRVVRGREDESKQIARAICH